MTHKLPFSFLYLVVLMMSRMLRTYVAAIRLRTESMGLLKQ